VNKIDMEIYKLVI